MTPESLPVAPTVADLVREADEVAPRRAAPKHKPECRCPVCRPDLFRGQPRRRTPQRRRRQVDKKLTLPTPREAAALQAMLNPESETYMSPSASMRAAGVPAGVSVTTFLNRPATRSLLAQALKEQGIDATSLAKDIKYALKATKVWRSTDRHGQLVAKEEDPDWANRLKAVELVAKVRQEIPRDDAPQVNAALILRIPHPVSEEQWEKECVDVEPITVEGKSEDGKR